MEILDEVQSLLQKGIDYYKGTNCTKKNPIKAMEYFDQASKLGCIKADYYIDVYNINSNGVKLLKKAADLGDPDAQKHYANYLKHGIIVTRNKGKTINYYKLAEDQGEKEAVFEYIENHKKK